MEFGPNSTQPRHTVVAERMRLLAETVVAVFTWVGDYERSSIVWTP